MCFFIIMTMVLHDITWDFYYYRADLQAWYLKESQVSELQSKTIKTMVSTG